MLDAGAAVRTAGIEAGRRKIAERYSRRSVVAAYSSLFEQLTADL
jgi:hypothetical protein